MNIKAPFEWLIAFSLLASGVTWAQQWGGPPIQYPPPQSMSADPAAVYCPPAAGGQYCPPNMPNLYSELVPFDNGFCYDRDSRLDLAIHEAFRGAWMRLEYLHGDIHRNDNSILGTPINVADPAPPGGAAQDVTDVAQQFSVLYTDGTTTGLAQVPTTADVSWNNAQGIRGSFGIPITKAMWVEARIWAYQRQTEVLHTPMFPTSTTAGLNGTINDTFLATTLTTDGVPGSRLILYDAGFHSLYTSRLIAGDVDLVFNWKTPKEGLRLQPILGYRHEQYEESLNFGGSFDNRSGFLVGQGQFTTPQTNDINSQIYNSREQMQLGLRSEFATRWLTIGHQEKFALGANLIKSNVATSNLREPGTDPTSATPLDDPSTYTSDRTSIIAPSFDLDVYAKVRLTDWMNFRIGYSLIWMGNVGAADKSIRFNETTNGTGGTDPDVSARIRFDDRVISALTLGGEIILP